MEIIQILLKFGIIKKFGFLAPPVPVDSGMIKEGNDTDIVARVNELADQIAPTGGVRRIIVGEPLGIVKGKAVVMSGRQRNVACACRLGGFGPVVSVKFRSGEGRCQLFIFLILFIHKII